MIDQCENCRKRGHYQGCVKTPCRNHNSWIAKTMISRIEALEKTLTHIAALPEERMDEASNCALNILAQLPPKQD